MLTRPAVAGDCWPPGSGFAVAGSTLLTVAAGPTALASGSPSAPAGASAAAAANPSAPAATNWLRVAPATSPPASVAEPMAYLPALGALVKVGQDGSGGTATWAWTGSTWRRLTPAHQPPGRFAPALALDPTHGVLVLFGGTTADDGSYLDGVLADTWTFDGTDWTEQHPRWSPSGRSQAAFAPDRTGGLVLFSGYGPPPKGKGTFAAGTFRWTGSAWESLRPAHSPEKRAAGAMAYDPVHRQTVLFGGQARLSNVDHGIGPCRTGLCHETWPLGRHRLDRGRHLLALPVGTCDVPGGVRRGARSGGALRR